MSHRFSSFVTVFVLIALAALRLNAAENAPSFTIDCETSRGEIRALHGGNCGPIQFGGLLDLTAALRSLHLPLTRLHDCHWPNPDVVDIHTIFPNSDADASAPGNYQFQRTDDYIQSVLDMDSQIVYRLGESIEHSKRKYFVHPPKDPAQWAAICCGIIAHYNDGWANGFKHTIRYWEIWNEPENRPAMWTGTDDDYFALYETAAKTIKKRWPDLKVGGPAVGYTGKLANGKFEPGEFIVHFLERCQSRAIPLDFFSWHLYTNDPDECLARAKGLRALLDAHGFTKTELHFNEWNYLPRNDWSPLSLKNQGAPRERFFEELGSAPSGAFAACVLLNLQDSPVDVANYYASDNIGFGLFTPNGVPRKAYYAFAAFRKLLNTPLRVEALGGTPGSCCVVAGLNRDKSELGILIANYRNESPPNDLILRNLPWKSESECEIYLMDATHNLERVRRESVIGETVKLPTELKGPAVLMVKVRKK